MFDREEALKHIVDKTFDVLDKVIRPIDRNRVSIAINWKEDLAAGNCQITYEQRGIVGFFRYNIGLNGHWLRNADDLADVLLHELLHAYVFEFYKCKDHRGEFAYYGKQLGVTTYHSLKMPAAIAYSKRVWNICPACERITYVSDRAPVRTKVHTPCAHTGMSVAHYDHKNKMWLGKLELPKDKMRHVLHNAQSKLSRN